MHQMLTAVVKHTQATPPSLTCLSTPQHDPAPETLGRKGGVGQVTNL